MPIASSSSFIDGLDADQRSREHFIAGIDLEDDRLWVPYNAQGETCRKYPLHRLT